MCGRVKRISDRILSLWRGNAIELDDEERDLEENVSSSMKDQKTAELSDDTIAEGLRQAKKEQEIEEKGVLLQLQAESGTFYNIMKIIGKGGFGEVYQADVEQEGAGVKLPSRVAIKAEKAISLNMEIRILNKMRGYVHFCTLYDQGVDPRSGNSYMIMTLLGPNLSSIRKAMPRQRLTLSTAIRCGVQMLHAIEELHSQGFVSRDVKPSNFAIGLPNEQRRLLYMLDFGIAQAYLNENGDPYPPNNNCTWRGTTRYCALANHRRHSPSPKDDVESWFYSMVELIAGRLPWTHFEKYAKQRAYKMKVGCRDRYRDLFIGAVPSEFDEMLTSIDEYSYYSKPEYSKFYIALIRVMDNHEISFSDDYDWEHVFEEYIQ
ncbi:Tau-tubulin kinase 1 [Aphelenchoides besseyi]|nr:Tau-tubulin kinase 1 [Aphelenchoides besseyi]KAI6173902.1 Tau-tubulin kinase 1 [Aphelenchoides besseyi]KAI6210547.1 Tau-tubulin kinase 1 [Aphelenchoides besseyi]KAI6210600.1 Tau-tubulin kinase 1 [Aphelenchoides besseyi]